MAKKRHVAPSVPDGEKTKLTPDQPLPPDVAELFERHQRYVEAGRKNYSRADAVLEQLLERCQPGCAHVTEGSGRKPPQVLTLVDQFADRNQVWAGSSCKRMKIEAKDVKAQDR